MLLRTTNLLCASASSLWAFLQAANALPAKDFPAKQA
jgi:hypothetical protein